MTTLHALLAIGVHKVSVFQLHVCLVHIVQQLMQQGLKIVSIARLESTVKHKDWTLLLETVIPDISVLNRVKTVVQF